MAASYFLGSREFTSKKGTNCHKIQLLVLDRWGDWALKTEFLDPKSEVWQTASEVLDPGAAVYCTFTFDGQLVRLRANDKVEPLNLSYD